MPTRERSIVNSQTKSSVISSRLKGRSSEPTGNPLSSFLSACTLPYGYLAAALATVIPLCFIVPPMQVLDENRHFMRAVQFSQGQWTPQVDVKTDRTGGVLPDAVFEFVRLTMSTDFLQEEQALHTVRE